MELRVLESFAHRLLENIDFVLGRSWWQHVRRTDQPEHSPYSEDFFFLLRFGEGLNLGHSWKARMFRPQRHLHHRMEVHQALFNPLRVATQHRSGEIGSRVQFTTEKRRIDL